MIEKPIVFNSFTLNNQPIRQDLSLSPNYDWWVRSAQWVIDQKSSPQPIPRAVGDYPGLAFRGSARLNLSGILVASNLSALRAGEAGFMAAIWDQLFHTLQYQNLGEAVKSISARISQMPNMTDSQENDRLRRNFTIQFYAPTTTGIF